LLLWTEPTTPTRLKFQAMALNANAAAFDHMAPRPAFTTRDEGRHSGKLRGSAAGAASCPRKGPSPPLHT
jgi:hypothetical protein